jgi:hypothetical protein
MITVQNNFRSEMHQNNIFFYFFKKIFLTLAHQNNLKTKKNNFKQKKNQIFKNTVPTAFPNTA